MSDKIYYVNFRIDTSSIRDALSVSRIPALSFSLLGAEFTIMRLCTVGSEVTPKPPFLETDLGPINHS
jgi:hypothetical protein